MMSVESLAVGDDLAAAIVETMRADERAFPRPSFPGESPYSRCRRPLVAWVIEVCEALGLGNVTTFHACDLMDRAFMSPEMNQTSTQPFFQLAAMACIFIAAKYGEADDRLPSTAELMGMSENFYPPELFRKAETQVLRLLGWNVACLTPLCFLKYYLLRTPAADPRLDHDIYCKVVLLLGLAVQDLAFTAALPSELCASAVSCAREIVAEKHPHPQNGFQPWTAAVDVALGYTRAELEPCTARLRQKYAEFLALQATGPRQASAGATAMDWESDVERQRIPQGKSQSSPVTPTSSTTS